MAGIADIEDLGSKTAPASKIRRESTARSVNKSVCAAPADGIEQCRYDNSEDNDGGLQQELSGYKTKNRKIGHRGRLKGGKGAHISDKKAGAWKRASRR